MRTVYLKMIGKVRCLAHEEGYEENGIVHPMGYRIELFSENGQQFLFCLPVKPELLNLSPDPKPSALLWEGRYNEACNKIQELKKQLDKLATSPRLARESVRRVKSKTVVHCDNGYDD